MHLFIYAAAKAIVGQNFFLDTHNPFAHLKGKV